MTYSSTTMKDSDGFRSESSWTPACGKVHEQYQQAKWSVDDCLDARCFPSTRPWRQEPWESKYLQQWSTFFSVSFSVFGIESRKFKECIDREVHVPMKLKTRARHSMGSATTRAAGMATATPDAAAASTWRMRLLRSSSISKSSQDATETAGFRGHTGKARSLATSSHIRIQANASQVWAWDETHKTQRDIARAKGKQQREATKRTTKEWRRAMRKRDGKGFF